MVDDILLQILIGIVIIHNMCYTYGKELVDKILEEQMCSIDEIENYITKIEDKCDYYDLGSLSLKELSDEWNKLKGEPPIHDQIASLKSQLKHCKNLLQKLNMEREMGRLIKERNKK